MQEEARARRDKQRQRLLLQVQKRNTLFAPGGGSILQAKSPMGRISTLNPGSFGGFKRKMSSLTPNEMVLKEKHEERKQ